MKAKEKSNTNKKTMCIELEDRAMWIGRQNDSEQLNLLDQKMGHLRFWKEMFIEELLHWWAQQGAGRVMCRERHESSMTCNHTLPCASLPLGCS